MDSLAIVSLEGAVSTAPSVLGSRAAGISIGGVIRAGIKELTHAAAQNSQASEVYGKGVEAGKDFDTIEAEIRAVAPDIKAPLVPKNVPYFTVRAADFPMPELAHMILKKYGEDRGDGVTRLYRFPVIFPIDNWQQVMPHALKCYGSSQLKYWSEYSSDGATRFCMTHAEVPTDPKTGKAVRLFGGRKIQPRADNSGLCDPEKCHEYQQRQCNLTGRLIFFIPGIPSISAVALPTTSFYAMNNIRQKLEMVGFMRGGRISGYLHGDQTFWLTKKLHEVARIDDKGKPTRVSQWLIELEANIDVSGLLLADLGEDTRPLEAEQAARILSHHAGVSDAEATVQPEPPIDPAQTPPRPPSGAKGDAAREELAAKRSEIFEMLNAAMIAPDEYSAYAGKRWKDPAWSKKLALLREVSAHLALIAPLRDDIHTRLVAMNIAPELFDRYAQQRFRRTDWDLAPESLRKAADELAEFADAPDKLQCLIETELEIH